MLIFSSSLVNAVITMCISKESIYVDTSEEKPLTKTRRLTYSSYSSCEKQNLFVARTEINSTKKERSTITG